MKKLILIIICLLSLLTGCINKESLNDIIYIDSVGLDFLNNEYIVYLHISNPSTLITQEQGAGNVEIKYSIASSSGPTIFQAMSNILKNTNLNINLGLVKSVVFTKNFYYIEHIDHLYSYLKSTPEIFPTFNIFYTDEEINSIFSTTNPKATSPFFSLIGEHITDSMIPLKNYSRFISEYKETTLTLSVPILKTNSGLWSDEDTSITSLSIDGVCALDKINNTQIEARVKDYPGLIFLSKGTITNQSIELHSEENLIIEFDYYDIRTKYYENAIHIEIDAIISAFNQKLDKTKMINFLQKEIENEVNVVYSYFLNHNIDILNINDYLYRYKLNPNNLLNVIINVNVGM